MHSEPLLQAALISPAHVWAAELHRPLAHAALVSPVEQLSCKPSAGSASPF
jgi:hypothetical protein